MRFKACLPTGFFTNRTPLNKGQTGRGKKQGATWCTGNDGERKTEDREDLATGVLDFILYSHKVLLAVNIFKLFSES